MYSDIADCKVEDADSTMKMLSVHQNFLYSEFADCTFSFILCQICKLHSHYSLEGMKTRRREVGIWFLRGPSTSTVRRPPVHDWALETVNL